jgi:hypothetical protein
MFRILQLDDEIVPLSFDVLFISILGTRARSRSGKKASGFVSSCFLGCLVSFSCSSRLVLLYCLVLPYSLVSSLCLSCLRPLFLSRFVSSLYLVFVFTEFSVLASVLVHQRWKKTMGIYMCRWLQLIGYPIPEVDP